MEEEVGYCRPPRQHRFKPGQSGNPKGRPKGARGFNALVRDVLNEKVAVRLPAGTRRMPVSEVMLRRLIEQGSKGDHRAIVTLLRLHQMACPEPTVSVSEVGPADQPFTETDEAILAYLKETIIGEASS